MNWLILRCSIILLFVCSWKRIIKFYGKRLGFDESLIIYWQAQQFKIFIGLVVFELFIVDNILLKFIQLL